MAEIKSTLEMVLERAAAMGAADQKDMRAEEKVTQGMRMAADYLGGRLVDLGSALAEQPPVSQVHLRIGIGKTLLRNIVLPRGDQHLEEAEKAMQGLLSLAAGAGDLVALISEIKQLLERYRAHREQLRQQLESAFSQQLEHAYAQQGGQGGLGAKIEPSQHPKFQQEWLRVQDDLNSQYGQALDQRKELMMGRLAPAV